MRRLVILSQTRYDEYYKHNFVDFTTLGWEDGGEPGPKDWCDVCGRLIIETAECLGTKEHKWVRLTKDRNDYIAGS